MRTSEKSRTGAGVRRSLEESLERLGLDRVDIVLVHDPDDHEREAREQALPALAELRDQGVVTAVGAEIADDPWPHLLWVAPSQTKWGDE